MALTANARGTGGNNTAASSIDIYPTSNFADKEYHVVVMAYDNAGSSGADPYSSMGTTPFASVQRALYDPGAASAGIVCGIFVGMPSKPLTTSDYIRINFSASTTAKAWALWGISSDLANGIAVYASGGTGTGAATGTPTITTSSITSGRILIAGGGAESANTWTGDTDTTNGTWSTQQSTGYGTGTSGASVTTQWKTVTASATQTYNPTLTSADCILAYAVFLEAAIGPLDSHGTYVGFFGS